ncbi:oxygenase MpaB family protein [Gordonia terrae]|uniref:oxygenase MpaB family protein n=1 Tax=Gordonia terrae TaxID=2055 RepID=UPI003F6D847A
MPAVVERMNEVAGTVFVALFAAGLFDQTLLPEVSAALVETGRIRDDTWGRGMRSAASDQLVFLGEEAEQRREMDRLISLHRDVKGVGPDGLRYSALKPENWNWILYSTFFVYRGTYIAVTRAKPSAEEDQAIWDYFRQKGEGLQLPGKARLLQDFGEVQAYYDFMVAEKLEVTQTTLDACARLRRLPRPPFLPAVLDPLWRLIRPIGGHLAEVLGFGIMHPGVRALMPMMWTRRHDVEFAVVVQMLRIAYRCLPTWVTDTPLARNRRQYRRLVAGYQGLGLASFRPDTPAGKPT